MPRVGILSAVETVTRKFRPPSKPQHCDDGRSRSNHWRLARRTSRFRQCDRSGSCKSKRHPIRGRRTCANPGRTGSGSRQYAGENSIFMAKADAAGLVLGARVPIILTSRADSVRAGWPLAQLPCFSPMPAGAKRRCRQRDRNGHDPGRQCGLIEREISGLRDRRSIEFRKADEGQVEGIGTRPRLKAQGATAPH